MMSNNYDWVNDEDVRFDLAAESVVTLFHERTMKDVPFESFYPHLQFFSWREYPSQTKIKLEGYYSSLQAAIEMSYKDRFGKKLNLATFPLKDCMSFYDLVLRVYCRYKEKGEIPT